MTLLSLDGVTLEICAGQVRDDWRIGQGQAVRARDVEGARRAMNEHLRRSRSYQAKEAQASTLKVPRPKRASR